MERPTLAAGEAQAARARQQNRVRNADRGPGMIVYADASMLVKRYLVEGGSNQVDTLLRPPTLAGTAMITRAEVAAALSKAARLGALTRAAAGRSLGEFRRHWPNYLRLRLNEAVVARADELAWEHG